MVNIRISHCARFAKKNVFAVDKIFENSSKFSHNCTVISMIIVSFKASIRISLTNPTSGIKMDVAMSLAHATDRSLSFPYL